MLQQVRGVGQRVDRVRDRVRRIAAVGWREALRADAALAEGLNTTGGRLVNAGVAAAHGLDAWPLSDVLG